MKTLKDYSNEELQFGIERCKARLSGVMEMGRMTPVLVKQALKQYKDELSKRGQNQLEFNE